MNLVLQTRNMTVNSQLREWIERRLAFALGRFASRLTEVRAVLTDENGPRGGLDRHCSLEARLKSAGSVVVDVIDTETETAVSRAADRLARRIRDTFERRRDIKRRPTGSRR